METPYTNHLTASDYESVYGPAEDTFLLLDAIESDLHYLENLQPIICLEIGSGSGVIISAIAKKFKNLICLATDINPHACSATQRTARVNSTTVDSINCNLIDTIRPHSIDLLLFNPPYVVTTDEELQQQEFTTTTTGQLNASTKTQKILINSWAGGTNGRRIIDELLAKLDAVLSPNGVLYLLLLRENKPDEIIEVLKSLNFKAIKLMERRIPGEYLYIMKINRSNHF